MYASAFFNALLARSTDSCALDKAKEAYDQWLAKVKQIEEENPYIE